MEALRQQNLIQGRDGSLFAPYDSATRAEAIVIVLRTLEAMSP